MDRACGKEKKKAFKVLMRKSVGKRALRKEKQRWG
jgi:hypothetical protein